MNTDFADEQKANTEYNRRCGGCFGHGVRYIAVGGDSTFRARPIPRNHVAPYAYIVASTIPCDCATGIWIVQKAAKTANPEAATVTPTIVTKQWRWLMDNCVFATPWACGMFVRDCIEQRNAAKMPSNAPPMALQATRAEKSDIDTALPMPRPEPPKSRPLEKAVARAVEVIPVF